MLKNSKTGNNKSTLLLIISVVVTLKQWNQQNFQLWQIFSRHQKIMFPSRVSLAPAFQLQKKGQSGLICIRSSRFSKDF